MIYKFLKHISLVVVLMASMLLGSVQPVLAVTPKVSLSPSTITLAEGETQQISISLDEPIIPSDLNPAYVDINLTSSDPSRLTVDTPTVSYAGNEWSQIKTFTISAVDDSLVNGDQTVVLNFVTASNSEYYSGFTGSVTVNLKDNEVAITSPGTTTSIYEGPLTVTGTSPSNVIVDVLVDGTVAGMTTVTNGNTWSVTIPHVSAGSHSITAEQRQQRQLAYLANRSFGTIDVVDVLSKSYIHEIVGPDTYYAAIYNSRNDRLYAASDWNGSCAIKTFNPTTFAIEDSISMSPDGTVPVSMGLAPAGNKLYELCTDGADGYTVIIIDTNTFVPTGSFALNLDPGDYPSGIAINPSDTEVWVRYNKGIKEYDLTSPTFDLLNTDVLDVAGNAVNNIVFNEDGTRAYTADSSSDQVYTVNLFNATMEAHTVSSNLSNLAFTPDFSKLYGISSSSSSLYVLDPSDLSVIDSQSTAQPPESLAITDDGLNFVVGDDHGSGQIYFGATSGNASVTNTVTAPNGGSYFTSTGNFIGPIHYEVTAVSTAVPIQVKATPGVPNTGLGGGIL